MKTKRERLRNASVVAVSILAFNSVSFAEVSIAESIANNYQAEYKKLKPEVELLESKLRGLKALAESNPKAVDAQFVSIQTEAEFKLKAIQPRLNYLALANSHLVKADNASATIKNGATLKSAFSTLNVARLSAENQVTQSKTNQNTVITTAVSEKPAPKAKDISKDVEELLLSLSGYLKDHESKMNRLRSSVASELGIKFEDDDRDDPVTQRQADLVALIAYGNYFNPKGESVLSASIFGVPYGAVRKEGFIVESDKISKKGQAVFLSPVKSVWGDSKLKIEKWGSSTIRSITQKVINEASLVYSFDGSKDWEELTSDRKIIGVLNEISALIEQNENLKVLDKTALETWSQKVAESKYVDGDIQSLDGQALQAKILLAHQKSLFEGVRSANEYFTSLKIIVDANAEAKVNLFSLASNATKLSDAARAVGRAKMLTGKLK
jgi:hypothetical protein|tara:strand:+ start:239 stop:1558 length:1320 start_codon:yes stop_codon:yes gene_type:complete